MGSVVCHCRSNSAHGRVKRAGNVYGRSWFPGTASTGGAERAEEPRRPLVLVARAPVREIARGNDQLRPDPQHEGLQRLLDLRLLLCTRVQIGYMEEACRHDRMRL